MFERLSRNLTAFRELDANLPIGVALAFLVISRRDGEITISEVAGAIGVSLPTASRYVSALGTNLNRHKEEGFGLVSAHEDIMERRRKLLRLTPKGKSFLNKLE